MFSCAISNLRANASDATEVSHEFVLLLARTLYQSPVTLPPFFIYLNAPTKLEVPQRSLGISWLAAANLVLEIGTMQRPLLLKS